MEPAFHFIFPMLAALAARVHVRHGIWTLVGLAIVSVAIDMDHLVGVPGASFHNVFVTVGVPFGVFAVGARKDDRALRMLGLALLIFLFSHSVLDLFQDGDVGLFYPLDLRQHTLTWLSIEVGGVTILGSSGIGLLLYSAVLLVVFYLEEMDFLLLGTHGRVNRLRKRAWIAMWRETKPRVRQRQEVVLRAEQAE